MKFHSNEKPSLCIHKVILTCLGGGRFFRTRCRLFVASRKRHRTTALKLHVAPHDLRLATN